MNICLKTKIALLLFKNLLTILSRDLIKINLILVATDNNILSYIDDNLKLSYYWLNTTTIYLLKVRKENYKNHNKPAEFYTNISYLESINFNEFYIIFEMESCFSFYFAKKIPEQKLLSVNCVRNICCTALFFIGIEKWTCFSIFHHNSLVFSRFSGIFGNSLWILSLLRIRNNSKYHLLFLIAEILNPTMKFPVKMYLKLRMKKLRIL